MLWGAISDRHWESCFITNHGVNPELSNSCNGRDQEEALALSTSCCLGPQSRKCISHWGKTGQMTQTLKRSTQLPFPQSSSAKDLASWRAFLNCWTPGLLVSIRISTHWQHHSESLQGGEEGSCIPPIKRWWEDGFEGIHGIWGCSSQGFIIWGVEYHLH